MPFPAIEKVREAVEKTLRSGLGEGVGDWTATLDDNREIEFRPSRDGTIEIEICLPDAELAKLGDDEPAEKTYRFRIVVQAIEG
jgi:hypothetical protein